MGTVGFCMGGALSLFAACTNPDSVAACVVYYGGHPKVSFDFDRLKAPVLGHWAEDDAFANATAKRVEAELASVASRSPSTPTRERNTPSSTTPGRRSSPAPPPS